MPRPWLKLQGQGVDSKYLLGAYEIQSQATMGQPAEWFYDYTLPYVGAVRATRESGPTGPGAAYEQTADNENVAASYQDGNEVEDDQAIKVRRTQSDGGRTPSTVVDITSTFGTAMIRSQSQWWDIIVDNIGFGDLSVSIGSLGHSGS
ncbi:hypothetical protein IAU59_007516 [Kwoniella sp. CBS 9459]